MITFWIKPDDGEPYKLTAESRDIYVWEKATKSGLTFNQSAENISIVICYEQAHIAARRLGHIPKEMTLQQFVESHDLSGYDSEADGEDDGEPGPTLPAP